MESNKFAIDWCDSIRKSIDSIDSLRSERNGLQPDLDCVIERYPMRINPYFLKVVRQAGEPLARQVIPDIAELEDQTGFEDPLGEENDSPVPNLTHRYPDRVLFLVTTECAVYCRFCTRKRKAGKVGQVTADTIEAGLSYIEQHTEVKDVLVSGGDPLMLSDEKLANILHRLKAVSHVEIIRIGTRIPGVLPQRVTPDLVEILQQTNPLFLNLHFNHPAEITEEVKTACSMLADAGIPMGSQTVLLRGINDDPQILEILFRMLLRMRIRPYYLLHADQTRGTAHFWTRIETGLDIMQKLRGYISGLAVPTYVVDLPGGGGKVPLLPEYIVHKEKDVWEIKNFLDKTYQYHQSDLKQHG
ncbi:KamA family radical SAM protein [candidate division KSB1 bacterium]|nr:KamA family radical SAM protein [candidate division KSB1 bacterium]